MTFREKLEAYEKIEKVCPTCGKKFYKNYTKYTLTPFCCLSCSTTYSSRINREERNKKISMGVIKSEKHKAHRKQRTESYKKRIEKYNENPNRCKVCNSIIKYKNRNNQTCSKKCGAVLIGIKNTGNSNIGGHRDKGGRSKSGYYKGIFVALLTNWCIRFIILTMIFPLNETRRVFHTSTKVKSIIIILITSHLMGTLKLKDIGVNSVI